MFTYAIRKHLGLLMAAVFTLACATAFAADDAASAADAASRNIDSKLRNTADDLNRELERATNQIHEAQRLGTSDSATNRYGSAADVDREIGGSVDKANAELRHAARRDDYTFQRRELENTRSHYYPNSKEYNQFTEQIRSLDRQFSTTENSDPVR